MIPRTVRKPKTPVKRKPISKPPKKKTGRPLTFNERGKKRLEEKFPDDDSDDSRIHKYYQKLKAQTTFTIVCSSSRYCTCQVSLNSYETSS